MSSYIGKEALEGCSYLLNLERDNVRKVRVKWIYRRDYRWGVKGRIPEQGKGVNGRRPLRGERT